MAKEKKEKDLDVVLATLFFGVERVCQLLEPFLPSKTLEVKEYIKNLESKKDDRLGLFLRK